MTLSSTPFPADNPAPNFSPFISFPNLLPLVADLSRFLPMSFASPDASLRPFSIFSTPFSAFVLLTLISKFISFAMKYPF